MKSEDCSENIIMNNNIRELSIGSDPPVACRHEAACKVCVDLTPNTPITSHGSDEEAEEELFWLSLCKRVRFETEAHEDEEEDDDYMDDYHEDYYNHIDPVSILKRPKTIHAPLPFAELPDLGIHGHYQLLDFRYREVHVSKITSASSVKTNASVILLAPNDVIHKDLVSLNSDSKYLVLRVSWDTLSYFFLRTLRRSYPDIPIVAVTDLDPHHLDLLTFLDTPSEALPICYGWDLSGEFENFHNTSIDFVDIKWLGLRHTDCQGTLLQEGGDALPPGFDEVICMLKVNPYLRSKKDWLEALDWLHAFGKSVKFHPSAPADPPGGPYLRLRDDFIANKLSIKDWV